MAKTRSLKPTRPRAKPVHAAITAVHGYVPPDILTNAELATLVDTSDGWITERTGIKERHILKGEGLGTSHMGAEAVRGLLSAYHRGVQRGRQSTNPEETAGGQQSSQAGKEHEA